MLPSCSVQHVTAHHIGITGTAIVQFSSIFNSFHSGQNWTRNKEDKTELNWRKTNCSNIFWEFEGKRQLLNGCTKQGEQLEHWLIDWFLFLYCADKNGFIPGQGAEQRWNQKVKHKIRFWGHQKQYRGCARNILWKNVSQVPFWRQEGFFSCLCSFGNAFHNFGPTIWKALLASSVFVFPSRRILFFLFDLVQMVFAFWSSDSSSHRYSVTFFWEKRKIFATWSNIIMRNISWFFSHHSNLLILLLFEFHTWKKICGASIVSVDHDQAIFPHFEGFYLWTGHNRFCQVWSVKRLYLWLLTQELKIFPPQHETFLLIVSTSNQLLWCEDVSEMFPGILEGRSFLSIREWRISFLTHALRRWIFMQRWWTVSHPTFSSTPISTPVTSG